MSKIVLIYTTFPSLEKAEEIANQAVKEKLAACVNIFPGAVSIYEWEDKLEKSSEYIAIFKTSPSKVEALKAWISKHHPYEVPAVLSGEIESAKSFYEYITNTIDKNGTK